MRITYIKLTNFANISTAMNATEIEIDFTQSKNKIILITGPNGGGKTSLLSCLHPFAYNGNFDVRSDVPLIVIGTNGYKEIHYKNGYDEYVIKHFYTHKKETFEVKSYIERNGIELNPNGNQTSFKDLVKEELSIEPDYLKLVRLGNNVTNFIDHKTTERKNFMGKILSDVDMYLQLHKKVNKDMIEAKSVISHLVDRISKLGIEDIEDAQRGQKRLMKHIKELSEMLESLQSDLSIQTHELSKYDNPLVLHEQLREAKSKQSKIERILSRKDSGINTVEECVNEITQLEKTLLELETNLRISKDRRTSILDTLDKLHKEYNDIQSELHRIEDSDEVRASEKLVAFIKARIMDRTNAHGLIDTEFSYTTDELSQLIVTLDKCNDILQTTYEFGKEPIRKAISFILMNENINSYVDTQRSSFRKNKLQSMCEYVFTQLVGKTLPKPACNFSDKCQVMAFYDKLTDLVTETPDVVVEDETFVTYTKMAHQNITTILKYIADMKDILTKLPKRIQDMFIMSTLFEKMEAMKASIYEKDILYAEMSKVKEYELLQEDIDQLKKENEKLKLLKASLGNSKYFESRLKELSDDLDRVTEEMDALTQSIEELACMRNDVANQLDGLNDLRESIEKKDEINSVVSELNQSLMDVSRITQEITSLESRIRSTQFQLNKSQEEYTSTQYRIDYYNSFMEELTKYKTKYDEMGLVRSALSSKEGIPLLYIQIYLKNVQTITNELLEVIYDDDLYIDDFVITADEFKIPYVRKDTSIKDVVYASQGERSFISLALSFALISQALSGYNILLLDEIDATLDTRNREKFLQVLERQIAMIEGEQIFVISHNNMFNAYPVDIIHTLNQEDRDNRLGNYLKIDKK